MSSQQKYVERLVIKASAGTGKTHNLTGFYLGSLGHVSKKWTAEDKEKFLLKGKTACAPEDIIAVTFTKKAAAELKERLRQDLLKEGRYDEAARVDGSLIGTVHSVCLRLLQEYALEAGNSPVAEELSEDDGAVLFRRAVAPLMEDFAYLNDLFYEFGMELGGFGKKDRSQAMLEFCRGFIAMARTNGLEGKLNELGEESFETVRKQMDAICPPLAGDGEAELASMHEELEKLIAVQKIEGNYERTGKVDKEEKAQGVKNLSTAEKKHLKLMAKQSSVMIWKDWLSLIGCEAGAKNETLQIYVEECTALGRRVFGLPQFRRDVEELITGMFRFASAAIERFTKAKQDAGVVDFADMERMAREALALPGVRERLTGRFRVLLVDEFQDTNPIQLSIFRLLGQLIHGTAEAPGRIIYVGDDKQSIYSFRGAAPDLTRECTKGGAWKEDSLDVCWRSLPDLCDFTNCFFREVEEEELRNSLLGPLGSGTSVESLLNIKSVLSSEEYQLEKAPLRRSLSKIQSLRFWLTGAPEDPKAKLSKNDIFASLARNIAGLCGLVDKNGRIRDTADARLAAQVSKIAKIGNNFTDDDLGTRPARPGDIAVLCRSNKDCVAVADALEALGIPAAVEREGLLEQEDVAFCLNAFRLVLSSGDKLAAAELYHALHGGDA